MQWTSYLGLYSNSCLIWIQIKGRFSTCILDSVVLYSCSGQAWGAVLPPWSVNTHDFVLTDRTLTRLLNKMKELSNKWSRRTQLSLSTFPPHQQNEEALNNLREKDIWRPKVLFIPKKRLGWKSALGSWSDLQPSFPSYPPLLVLAAVKDSKPQLFIFCLRKMFQPALSQLAAWPNLLTQPYLRCA